MIWLAAAGRYDRKTRNISLAAVVTGDGGKAFASAMQTVNASKPHSKLECGMMALEMGAGLAKANGYGTAAIWPAQSDAAASVCRSVSPGGNNPSGDYFRKDVRIVSHEPDAGEKAYLDGLMATLDGILAESDPPGFPAEIAGKCALAAKAVELYRSTPAGGIRDADTILKDFVDEADMELTGIGLELIEIWLNSPAKAPIERVFHNITGREFKEYLEECVAMTSR